MKRWLFGWIKESIANVTSGVRAATIGGGLGVALLLFASSLPRVRADILSVSACPVMGEDAYS